MSLHTQVVSQQRVGSKSDALLQSIDDDVEKMNFKLISVKTSIRRMLAERPAACSQSCSSMFSVQAQSRKDLEVAASKVLLSRKMQQDKRIRHMLKRNWENETQLINDVAVPLLKLPKKTAALVIESRKKMFEKKIQLLKLDSELKNLNLASVISENALLNQFYFLIHFSGNV
jgi:hypothetical protein